MSGLRQAWCDFWIFERVDVTLRLTTETQSTSGKKLAAWPAAIAAALAFTAVIIGYLESGDIQTTPLFGGLFMLALAVSSYLKLRNSRT